MPFAKVIFRTAIHEDNLKPMSFAPEQLTIPLFRL